MKSWRSCEERIARGESKREQKNAKLSSNERTNGKAFLWLEQSSSLKTENASIGRGGRQKTEFESGAEPSDGQAADTDLQTPTEAEWTHTRARSLTMS